MRSQPCEESVEVGVTSDTARPLLTHSLTHTLFACLLTHCSLLTLFSTNWHSAPLATYNLFATCTLLCLPLTLFATHNLFATCTLLCSLLTLCSVRYLLTLCFVRYPRSRRYVFTLCSLPTLCSLRCLHSVCYLSLIHISEPTRR